MNPAPGNFARKLTDKIANSRGMSLVELLAAIIVLLLVTSLMVIGVRLGVKTYVKSVSMSEAQMLCSMLTTTVSDELRYAGTIGRDGDGKVGFFSQSFGGNDEGGSISCFDQDEKGQVTLGGRNVLGSKAYPYGLKARVDLDYNETKKTFSAEIHVFSSADDELALAAFETEPLNQ